MRSLFFIKSPDRELGKSFVRKRRLYSCVSAWLRLDFKVKTNVRFEQLCLWEKKGGGRTFASETEAKSVFSKVSGLPCPALRMSAYSSFLLGHHPFVIVIVNCNLDLLPLAQQVNINFYPTQVRSFGYPCQCLTNGLSAV